MKKTASHSHLESIRRPTKGQLQLVAVMLLAVSLTACVLVPFLWVISTAVKSQGDVSQDPLGLPNVWHWDNFPKAWSVGHFGQYFGNSIKVVVPSVAGVLILSLLAAYAFALMSFRGRNLLFLLFVAGLTVPESMLIIPLFYETLSLKIVNTLWALILPQIAISLPFAVLLLQSFIKGLPQEILDAAVIDGCSPIRLLWEIVVPLSRPAILSLVVFNFMWAWNDFLFPIVLIQSDANRTLPVGLNYFQGRFLTDLPLMMAGAIITFVPLVLVYVAFQRQFIQGITSGAVK